MLFTDSRSTDLDLSTRVASIQHPYPLIRVEYETMVHSSPLKRSALGSISSILNTTPKTPAKQGRVGKSATPRSNGIRQKIAHIFTSNKENSSRKKDLEDWREVETTEVC
jgi:hypothetical protein